MASNSINATTPDQTAPSVPANLVATPASQTQVNLTWNASTDNVAVTAYQVFRGGVQVATVAGVAHSDTVAGVGTYSYTVAACDAAGNCSAQTGVQNATTPDQTPPGAPTLTAATPTNQTTVTLTWTAPADNVAVTYYQIYRGGVFSKSVTSAFLTTTDTVAGVGTYSYFVTACDAANNCSVSSNSLNATTPDQTAPSVPAGLVAKIGRAHV